MQTEFKLPSLVGWDCWDAEDEVSCFRACANVSFSIPESAIIGFAVAIVGSAGEVNIWARIIKNICHSSIKSYSTVLSHTNLSFLRGPHGVLTHSQGQKNWCFFSIQKWNEWRDPRCASWSRTRILKANGFSTLCSLRTHWNYALKVVFESTKTEKSHHL